MLGQRLAPPNPGWYPVLLRVVVVRCENIRNHETPNGRDETWLGVFPPIR